MARKKIRLELIPNRSTRKATLKKRREGLIKKVRELITLCAVKAFIMIYSPDDPEPEPVIWPSDSETEQLITRFRNLSMLEQSKKGMDQKIYFKEKLTKDQEQLKKIHRKNKEKEGSYLVYRMYNEETMGELSVDELQKVIKLMEEKRKDMKRDTNCFHQVPLSISHDSGGNQIIGQSSDARLGPDATGFLEPFGWNQWFTNMINHRENMGASSSIQATGIPYDMVMPHQMFLNRYGSPDMGMLPPFMNIARGASGTSNNFEAHIGTSNELQGLPPMNYDPSYNPMMPGNSLLGVSDELLHGRDNNYCHSTELQGLPPAMNYGPSNNTMMPGNSLLGVSDELLHGSDNNSCHATESGNDRHSDHIKP